MSRRFPAVTSREVIKILEKVGFSFLRQAGSSHAIYKRQKDGKRTTVPVHAKTVVKRKTLASILRDAGLTIEEFNRLRAKRKGRPTINRHGSSS